MELISLFVTFFKVGITTFGGGYAMLPILIREIAEKKKWATEDELLEYFAIGQATPGIIAVNTASFVGYKRCGTMGAFVATFGFIAPSILVITLIYRFIDVIEERFSIATHLIKITVSALIFHTLYKMFLKEAKTVKKIILIFLAFGLALLNIPLPIIVISFALFSILEEKYVKFNN